MRPDGRILGLAGDVESVLRLFEGVRRGAQHAPPAQVADPAINAPEVAAIEHAWQALSELIDQTPVERREQVLVRLSMLLARRVDPAALSSAVEAARSVPD